MDGVVNSKKPERYKAMKTKYKEVKRLEEIKNHFWYDDDWRASITMLGGFHQGEPNREPNMEKDIRGPVSEDINFNPLDLVEAIRDKQENPDDIFNQMLLLTAETLLELDSDSRKSDRYIMIESKFHNEMLQLLKAELEELYENVEKSFSVLINASDELVRELIEIIDIKGKYLLSPDITIRRAISSLTYISMISEKFLAPVFSIFTNLLKEKAIRSYHKGQIADSIGKICCFYQEKNISEEGFKSLINSCLFDGDESVRYKSANVIETINFLTANKIEKGLESIYDKMLNDNWNHRKTDLYLLKKVNPISINMANRLVVPLVRLLYDNSHIVDISYINAFPDDPWIPEETSDYCNSHEYVLEVIEKIVSIFPSTKERIISQSIIEKERGLIDPEAPDSIYGTYKRRIYSLTERLEKVQIRSKKLSKSPSSSNPKKDYISGKLFRLIQTEIGVDEDNIVSTWRNYTIKEIETLIYSSIENFKKVTGLLLKLIDKKNQDATEAFKVLRYLYKTQKICVFRHYNKGMDFSKQAKYSKNIMTLKTENNQYTIILNCNKIILETDEKRGA